MGLPEGNGGEQRGCVGAKSDRDDLLGRDLFAAFLGAFDDDGARTGLRGTVDVPEVREPDPQRHQEEAHREDGPGAKSPSHLDATIGHKQDHLHENGGFRNSLNRIAAARYLFDKSGRHPYYRALPSETSIYGAHVIKAIIADMESSFRKGIFSKKTSYRFSVDQDTVTVTIDADSFSAVTGEATGAVDCSCKTSADMFGKIWFHGYKPGIMDFMGGAIKADDPFMLPQFLKAFGKELK